MAWRPPTITCPCCGYITMTGTYDCCPLCAWTHDPAQEIDATDDCGANKIGLQEARRNVELFGMSEPQFGPLSRRPTAADIRDPRWGAVEVKSLESWMDELRYQAILPEPFDDSTWQTVDGILQRFGFTRANSQPRPDIRTVYVSADGTSVYVAMFRSDNSSHLLCEGVNQAQFVALGGGAVVALLASLSDGLRVRLGRSVGEAFNETVFEREIDGAVDCLDWCQFFGSDLWSRWHLDHLRAGPFHEVRTCEHGGYILMGPSPFEPLKGIKAAAEYLGIQLRPVNAPVRGARPMDVNRRR